MTERMTAAEFQAMQTTPGAKYGNQKATVRGITFDSKREASRYILLRQRERMGEISDLRLQVPIALMGQTGPILTPTGRQMIYRADFTYREAGALVIEDAKGMRTKEYVVKAGIVRAMGYDLREV